jgi:hypothetical protein
MPAYFVLYRVITYVNSKLRTFGNKILQVLDKNKNENPREVICNGGYPQVAHETKLLANVVM